MRRTLLLLPVFPLVLAACADDGDDGTGRAATASPTPAGETVRLSDAEGDDVGTVTFTEQDGEVVVRASLTDLSEGFHGFHIHSVGRCDAPEFTSAGGHHAGDGGTHGEHAGDLPPLLVTDGGDAELVVRTDRFTMDELDDEDGSAVVVHVGRDNLAHIPDRYEGGPDDVTERTGDAGEREACGVIFPDESSPSPGATGSPATGSPGTGSPTPTDSPSPTTSPVPIGTGTPS